MGRPVSFEEWQEGLPRRLTSSPVWQFGVYPKVMFLYDLVWFDCERLLTDPRGKAIAEQLIRSAGSIAANIKEGYGRGFGRDYARFLGFALGSARETQGWYFRARHLLSADVVEHRTSLLDEVIGLLVIAVNQQRNYRHSPPATRKEYT
jgi:four helix bundle protein